MPKASSTSLRPMPAVVDRPATVRFCVGRLGFNRCGLFGDPPAWAELGRGGVATMFGAPLRAEGERHLPRSSRDHHTACMNTTDAGAQREEFPGRDAAVSGRVVMPYQMKEFDVRDPGSDWLMFGQPTNDPPTVSEA